MKKKSHKKKAHARMAKKDQFTWHLFELQTTGDKKPCVCATERQPGFGGALAAFASKSDCEKARKQRHLGG